MSPVDTAKQQAKELARSALQRVGFCPVRFQGQWYRLDTDHLWLWRKLAQGEWEPETFKVFDTHLTEGSTLVDIGAHIGVTSILGPARRCAKVLAFEPDPVAFGYLQRNLALNRIDNVIAENVAVAAETGSAGLAPYHGSQGDSSSSLTHPDADSAGITVPTRSWDDIAAEHNVAPDLFKIDIEGGEFELLPSMASHLHQHRPVIWLSTHAGYFRLNQGRRRMRRLAEVLGDWSCHDEQMRPVSFDLFTSDEAASSWRTWLFTP